MGAIHLIEHPLVKHKLAMIRNRETESMDFRRLLDEIIMLMAYEFTKGLPLKEVSVETPVCHTKANVLAGKEICIVPVLRAGLGMVEGIQKLIPDAVVGHIGLYRDPETLEPKEYYCKLPADIDEREVFVLDPMLATGGSASAAISYIKKQGCKSIRLVNLIAAPEGVKRIQNKHPDVDIYAAALDDGLNPHAYIVPGLGDAGDRMFGTE